MIYAVLEMLCRAKSCNWRLFSPSRLNVKSGGYISWADFFSCKQCDYEIFNLFNESEWDAEQIVYVGNVVKNENLRTRKS